MAEPGGYRDGPYDPPPQNSKLGQLKEQVQDATKIMQGNIEAVTQRGASLQQLQDTTDGLAVSAQNFRKGANRVRKNMWWKDMKMRLIIGAAVVIIIVIIVVAIVKTVK